MRIQSFFNNVFILLLLLCTSTAVWAVSGPQSTEAQKTYTIEANVAVVNQATSKKVGISQKSVLTKVELFVKRGFTTIFKTPSAKRPRDPGEGQAIASLILGILGVMFVTFIPFSILAMVFGSIAKRKYREGYHDRWGMAKAGVILGIVGIGLAVIFIGVSLLPLFLI